MKKFFLAYAFLVFCFFSCSGDQKAFVSGDSELFNVGDSLHFSNRPLEDFPIVQLFEYKGIVDSAKHFQVEIPLKKPSFISLSSGLTFYTAPKDVVHFVVEAQAKVKYEGKYANLNNALVSFKIAEAAILSPIFEKYFSPESGQLNYNVSIITDVEDAVVLKKNELIEEFKLNSEEIEIFNGAIRGYQKRIIFIASLYIPKEIFDTISDSEKKTLTDFDISIAEGEKFPSFLTTVYLKMIEESIRTNQMNNISAEDIDRKISSYNLTATMKDDLYAYSLIMLLNQMSAGQVDASAFTKYSQSIDLFLSKIKNTDVKKNLQTVWKDAAAYFNPEAEPVNEPASEDKTTKFLPEFKMEDDKGIAFTLNQFSGKVVYLDFWATWCAPCLEQIPAMNKIQNKYKNNSNVVFISISVDKDKAQWKSALLKHKMQGIHGFAGENHPSIGLEANQIDVSVVPSFYLVSKFGELLSAAAPSAEEELSLMIDSLLDKD